MGLKNYSLENCEICPQNCGVNRILGEKGICQMPANIVISSYGPHFGEEPELVGLSGSGTIFFTGCNLKCIFCQNWDISHNNIGKSYQNQEVIDIMLYLQEIGCLNINLVTPTHFSLQLIEILENAKAQGLKIPIVYNTNCYDKVEILRSLDGIIDIYMPDLKFIDTEISKKMTRSSNYFEVASAAIIEMHRQVGDLVIKNGIAKRGLIVRHLVMPNNYSNTIEIIDFIAEKLGTDTYLNLMEQYRPAYKAYLYNEINKKMLHSEFMNYVKYAIKRGFYRPLKELYSIE